MFRVAIILAFWLNLINIFAQTALPPAEQASIYSANCQLILDSCPFAQEACVSNYCSGAPNVDLGSCDRGNLCCNKANPQACFVSANIQDACNNIQNSVVLCPSAAAAQATCICGAGSEFDAQASQCASLVSKGSHTNIASLLSGSKGALGYCARVAGQTPVTASGASATGGSNSVATTTTAKNAAGGLNSSGSTPSGTASAPVATKTSGAVGIVPRLWISQTLFVGAVALGLCV